MSTITDATKTRSLLFKQKVESLNLSPRDLGRIFGLGDSAEETSIRRKLREEDSKSFRTPTKSDVLAINLLDFLKAQGYDLMSLKFDDTGQLVQVKKAKKRTND
jgi:hypothetical protein